MSHQPAPPRRRTVLEGLPRTRRRPSGRFARISVSPASRQLRSRSEPRFRWSARDKENARLNTRLDLPENEKRIPFFRGRSASGSSDGATAKKLSSESLRLHREVRILGDAEARARSLSDEVFWLRHALEVSKAGKEKLKARLAKLRAAGATLSKLPFDEGCPTACGPEAVAAPEDDDERAAQAKRPSAQDRAEVGDPESGAGGSACQASRDQEGTRVRACRASGGQEDVVEVAVRCRRRSPQGSAKVAAPEGYDQVAVPGERLACARARRRRGTGSRRWKSSLRGFVRPGRCCRGRSTAARASSRTSRARNTSAASSAARPAAR